MLSSMWKNTDNIWGFSCHVTSCLVFFSFFFSFSPFKSVQIKFYPLKVWQRLDKFTLLTKEWLIKLRFLTHLLMVLCKSHEIRKILSIKYKMEYSWRRTGAWVPTGYSIQAIMCYCCLANIRHGAHSTFFDIGYFTPYSATIATKN